MQRGLADFTKSVQRLHSRTGLASFLIRDKKVKFTRWAWYGSVGSLKRFERLYAFSIRGRELKFAEWAI